MNHEKSELRCLNPDVDELCHESAGCPSCNASVAAEINAVAEVAENEATGTAATFTVVHKTTIHCACPDSGEWKYYAIHFEPVCFYSSILFQGDCNMIRGCPAHQEQLTQALFELLPDGYLKIVATHGSNTKTTTEAETTV